MNFANHANFWVSVSVPILEYITDFQVEDEEELARRIECRHLLLQAGADPTLPDSDGTGLVQLFINDIPASIF